MKNSYIEPSDADALMGIYKKIDYCGNAKLKFSEQMSIFCIANAIYKGKFKSGGRKMKWKYKRITELTGGALSGNLVTVARAVNNNSYVLKEAVQKIEELNIEVEKLKEKLDGVAE